MSSATITTSDFFDARRRTERQRLAQAIDDYLTDCYANQTVARVTELALRLDMSHPQLCRSTRQLFGLPAGTILRNKRLAEAKRLLTTTALTVDEIAIASAFGTRTTLFRMFQRRVRMTPGQYRHAARVQPPGVGRAPADRGHR